MMNAKGESKLTEEAYVRSLDLLKGSMVKGGMLASQYYERRNYQALRCVSALFRKLGKHGEHETSEQRRHTIKHRINDQFWWSPENIPCVLGQYYIHNPVPGDKEFPYYQSHWQAVYHGWFVFEDPQLSSEITQTRSG